MEVVNLVGRDRRSLEYGQSSVCEDRVVRSAGSPVLTRHIAEVGGWCTPSQTFAFVIRAHAAEAVAARQLSLEVIDIGKLDVGRSWLVVIAVLIEPRNRIRAHSPVRYPVVLRDGRSTGLQRGLRVQPLAW